MTELKATTNQKLRIYDTVAPGPTTADFSHGIQLLGGTAIVPGYQHFLFISGASFMQRLFQGLSSLHGIFFSLHLSWMYDLGVWARMTGSSKAQGQGDTYHFFLVIFFSCLVIFGRPF